MTAAGTRPQQRHQERVTFYKDVASVAATTAIKLANFIDRVVRLDHVFYDNPTGFAQDPANYWIVSLTDGVNTLAKWSTQTGQQGTLAADTPVNLVLTTGAAPNADLAQGSTLTLVLTKVGAPAAIPAGQLFVDGHAL